MTVFEIYNTFIGATVTISACPIRGSRPGWKATLTHNGAVIARCSGMGMSRAEVKAHVETLWGLDVATQKAPLEYNRTSFTEDEKDQLKALPFGQEPSRDEEGCAFILLETLVLRKRRTGFDNESRPLFVFEVRELGADSWEQVSWLVAKNLR